jgi:hypothetical protein
VFPIKNGRKGDFLLSLLFNFVLKYAIWQGELKDSLEQVYMEESDPTEQWTKIKEAMLTKGKNILRLRQRKEVKDWNMEETWEEINRCKITKQKINNADDEKKPTLLEQYADINKRIKRYARCINEHG